jgi:RNA polymerase sigma-70 factor (ECF subfamily)
MPKPDASPGHGKSVASTEGAWQAFAQHFSQSFPILWTIAVGLVGNRATAEDVVQDAALIGLEKFGQFQEGTSFTAWMGQMVRHVALNAARKEQRQRAGLKLVEQQRVIPRATEGEVTGLGMMEEGRLPADQRMFDDRMMRALGEVGEAARACLLLRTLAGLEYAEISKLLEIPQGTAMSHVHRAREFLRQRLGGMEPPANSPPVATQIAAAVRKPA